jgi:hypothetical protein
MGATDAIGIHFEAEFQIVFTVVVAVAACIAGWRCLRAVLRRRAETRASEQREDDTP